LATAFSWTTQHEHPSPQQVQPSLQQQLVPQPWAAQQGQQLLTVSTWAGLD